MSKVFYDITIVGGSMVGAALALNLAQSGFEVLVLESVLPVLKNTKPDLRVSAISCASVQLLQRINTWPLINAHFCVPYRRLETWEYPFSLVVFDAASLHLSELGFIVENWRLQQALWQSFDNYDTLTLFCPVSISVMFYNGEYWRIILDDGRLICSRLLVGADGAYSKVRQQAGITVSGWQYRQSCMLLSAKTEDNQQDTTWQVFTPSGPKAFLPLYDQWVSLVWYDSTVRIRQLQKLSLLALEREVQTTFPKRLGKVKLQGAASFPLTRCHAHEYIKPGLALIGDAAHTVNPLAGQGVNLGFRDVEALAKVLIDARNRGESLGNLAVLKRYQHRRRSDNLLMQAGIDLFYIVFSNNLYSLKLARNLSFMLVQRVEKLKKQVLKYALGL